MTDNFDIFTGKQIMEMLFAVLGSGQDKSSEDFKEMVVSLVDQINSCPKKQKEIDHYKKFNYDWRPI